MHVYFFTGYFLHLQSTKYLNTPAAPSVLKQIGSPAMQCVVKVKKNLYLYYIACKVFFGLGPCKSKRKFCINAVPFDMVNDQMCASIYSSALCNGVTAHCETHNMLRIVPESPQSCSKNNSANYSVIAT